ncbi:hypothetical protein M569_10421, partial [Genlisea aurea]
MIIKKNMKRVMPIVKRCRVGDSAGGGGDDDDESSAKRKKRKLGNGYFPLHLLGEAAAGIISISGYGIHRIMSNSAAGNAADGGGSCRADIDSMRSKPTAKDEISRPPLVRTSRGRVQFENCPETTTDSPDKSYGAHDFFEGDIVWATSGNHSPAWPAIVLNQQMQIPQKVLNCRVPGALCVMFFGYSGNGTQRDYAWIKRGMIFPFIDYVDRFQGQTELNDSKPSELRSAIEEAFLAENGFSEMLMVEINAAAGRSDYLCSISRGVFEDSDSAQDQQGNSADRLSFFPRFLKDVHMKKESKSCEACGVSIAPNFQRKTNSFAASANRLCSSCARV